MSFFEVSEDQITRLNDVQLTELVSRLLELEASEVGIPYSSIETTLNIKTPDGGLDAHVDWTPPPIGTDFISTSPTGFQIKATTIGPTACGDELVHDGKVKPLLDALFSNAGTYVLVNNRSLTTDQISERLTKMRAALAKAGAAYAHSAAIEICSANRLKMWANKFLPAISFVQSITGATRLNGLRPWREWEGIVNTSGEYFLDDPTKNVLSTLRSTLSTPKKALRLRGLSGLGKTRLALEAFRPNGSDSISGRTVYYDAANARNIDLRDAVIEWCRQKLSGVIVVDNCPTELHSDLQREVEIQGSRLSLLTLSANPEERLRNTTELTLKQCDSLYMLEVVKKLAPALQTQDAQKIANLSSGFVFFAKLLCGAWENSASLETALPDKDWVMRMLGSGDRRDSAEYRVVEACALFDSVDLGRDGNSVEAQFVAGIAQATTVELYAALKQFQMRGIAESQGTFIRIRPHPLAVKLCTYWWDSCSPHRAQEIFDAVPESMLDSLCERMRMLGFLPEARELVARLSTPTHPFGQAEMLKSARGARILRALVEVNPEAVMSTLSRVINLQDRSQLSELKDARREWVWTLERLVFLRDQYFPAAKALAALAISENEAYSNNATGTLLQTFHVRLPGTQAPLTLRSSALAYLFESATDDVSQSLAIDAAAHALETEHFTRTIGAEDQGLGPSLEEYEPENLAEVVAYWSAAIKLLVEAGSNDQIRKEKVLETVARRLRGLIRTGHDELAKQIIDIAKLWQIRPWLAGLDALGDVVRFEGKHLSDERKRMIEDWISVISPAADDKEARLVAIVSQPSWTAFSDEDESGKPVNTAEMAALSLADEVLGSPTSWIAHLNVLILGEQRLGFAFGKHLGSDARTSLLFMETLIESLRNTKPELANLSVLVGMLKGIQERDEARARQIVALFISDDRLQTFAPTVLANGAATIGELMSLFPLIENKAIDVMSLKLFAYGRALDHLPPNEIAMFAHKLSNEGSEGAWVALEVLFMYCFGDTTGQRWLGVKQLVRNLYLNGNLSLTDEPGRREFHTWEECARKLLKDSDDALALTLTKQLIAALASDLRTFELPNGVVRDLLSEYGAIAWPFFSEALLSRSGATSYRLANVLGIGFASRQEDKGGAIDLLESEVLVESIKDNRQLAAVVASMVSLLSNKGGILALTPMTEYLIEAFGNEDAVLGQIANNLFTGTWWGSRIPYYKDVASLFSRYISHPNANVRHWATRLELSLNTSIERDQASEDAHKVGRY